MRGGGEFYYTHVSSHDASVIPREEERDNQAFKLYDFGRTELILVSIPAIRVF